MTRRDEIQGLEDHSGVGRRYRVVWLLLITLLAWFSATPGKAQEPNRETMKGLDEQVQEIKSDVLGIAAELSQLEERLLFPSNTQVSLFVSLAAGETFRLDAVQVQIDGVPVAHHIYSFKELEALQKGGVQRLYTGNVPTGAHALEVLVTGKLAGGSDFSRSGSFSFSKDVEPKLVGITLAGPESGAAIQVGDW